MEITQEQYEAYEAVRVSGITNMFAINVVIIEAEEESGIELTRDEVVEIMRNYRELSEKYSNEIK